MTTDATLPRRKGTRIRDDGDARRVVSLLAQIAARVKHQPAVRPPEDGMIRLGGMDRASYVWFLRCPDGSTSDAGLCNHGLGVDRQYGAYEVRAWLNGAPAVHSVSIHTHVLTLELLETAAKLVGIPLEAPPWVGPLDAACPVCLIEHVPHDGFQLEAHKTPAGHNCHGSGWLIAREHRG